MNDNNETDVFADSEPDIEALAKTYETDSGDLATFAAECSTAYDDRRNIWPGKSADLRKNGATAFPWKGASDQEVNVVGERLNTYIALFDQALQRSHIKAFPTSSAAMPRASVVSLFLKWMRSTYIPDFSRQMEQGANHLLEKGMMISYVGWKRELRTFLQTITLDEIKASAPDLVELILDPAQTDMLVETFKATFPDITVQRAKKAIRQLRSTGSAEIPVPRVSVDCPVVYACTPDNEIIFPNYVTDPQRSPYFFWRTFLTRGEVLKRKISEDWDEEWVDYAINNLVGKDSAKIESEANRNVSLTGETELIMVVYAYQRLIDEIDGSEGIYLTVFHPDAKGYAKHELLNGHDNYPLVVTRLSESEKRLYETEGMTAALRGPQMQIKTERDSRVDRASLATLPPLMHPAGRPPSEWGPGRKVPYRRAGEIAFGPTPPSDTGSVEVEMAMRQQADRAVGLDNTVPQGAIIQQYYVTKFLGHVRDVLDMAWKMFQRHGPDEVWFQVSGNPNPQRMPKGNADETYQITVSFDTMSNDPETAETRMKQIGSLVQYDRNGLIDMNKFLEFAAMSIDPMLADYILQPAEQAQEKMAKDVTDDLAKIYAGIEVPARPNGATAALQLIQAYASQPDITQRAMQDEPFGQRLQKYAEQYTFQLQQAQNAEIGKIGTAPAAVGGVTTQGMQQ